jgi:hypothetical protein
MNPLEHYFVDSSFINHLQWNPANKEMIVTFTSGSVWSYANIPQVIYLELVDAPSIGAVFNSKVRNHYHGEVLFKVGKKSKIIYSKGKEIGQETQE